MKILALQILIKTTMKWGIYTHILNLPVGSRQGNFCPSGRLAGRPANGHIFDH